MYLHVHRLYLKVSVSEVIAYRTAKEERCGAILSIVVVEIEEPSLEERAVREACSITDAMALDFGGMRC